MQYDFIGLAVQKISGIKNPILTLIGTFKENCKFIVKTDGNDIPFNIDINNNDFILTANLSSSFKNVKVFIVVKSKEYLIYNENNSKLRIIKEEIENKIDFISSTSKAVFITLGKGIKYFWKEYHFLVPPSLWKKYLHDYINRVKVRGNKFYYNPFNVEEYNKWLDKNEKFDEIQKFKYNPLISILIPVYNIDKKYLSQCLDSILNQTYDNFEICLVDDASTKIETINTLKEYDLKDKRIKVKYRQQNGHISQATNDALNMAKGEFIGLVDDDDLLAKNALYEVVKVLNKNKSLDFIYSDEDKINLNNVRCDPHFKPDFSPDTLLSLNYICHFSVLRTELVKKLNGFKLGLEGAQDYDLFLRVSEQTNNIYHIPKILYHWRMIEGSTSLSLDNKNYANDKGKIAIENALKRRKIDATVSKDSKSGYYYLTYNYKKEPLVSIIIPTKDYADILDNCLKSIYQKTTYQNYEIIIINNNSTKKNTFNLFDKYKTQYKNFRVIDANFEFNYSKLNNIGVDHAKGEYIVLLNNDTEIISPEWLSVMIGYAMQPHIGAVGPKLLYPDKTVQHGGVILGLGGVASHAYIGALNSDLGMFGKLRVPYNYSAVTAACLIVSKKKYIEVNGLDEKLKVAYNDIDFNLKLLDKGYFNIFIPQVCLIHYESKSRGYDTTTEKYKRFEYERDFMFNKWNDKLLKDKFYNSNFSNNYSYVLDIEKK